MSKKYKAIFSLAAIVCLVLLTIHYFQTANIAVLNPSGPVAQKERNLIIFVLALSLIIVIPVFVLLFAFAWRYREGNKKAKYSPHLDHNAAVETIWWLIPSALIAVFAVVTWNSSHTLDPYRPLSSRTKPMTIQVVALNWKWLFIYPHEDIATVNYVQFPVNTPLNFQITSDAPMNSFWIPQLGGQIYAMPGMSTQMHLMASQTGDFRGSSANISGRGFAGMEFTAKASSENDFKNWTHQVKKAPVRLDLAHYNQLAQPSQNNPVSYYSSGQLGLYNNVVLKYMMPGMAGYIQ